MITWDWYYNCLPQRTGRSVIVAMRRSVTTHRTWRPNGHLFDSHAIGEDIWNVWSRLHTGRRSVCVPRQRIAYRFVHTKHRIELPADVQSRRFQWVETLRSRGACEFNYFFLQLSMWPAANTVTSTSTKWFRRLTTADAADGRRTMPAIRRVARRRACRRASRPKRWSPLSKKTSIRSCCERDHRIGNSFVRCTNGEPSKCGEIR